MNCDTGERGESTVPFRTHFDMPQAQSEEDTVSFGGAEALPRLKNPDSRPRCSTSSVSAGSASSGVAGFFSQNLNFVNI